MTVKEDDYSPLSKNLLSVFNACRRQGYGTLFVFRDGWGDTHFTAARPHTDRWAHFSAIAAPHGAKRPLIAFDLNKAFAAQMPDHLLPTLETLDAFAFNPLIHVPDRTGHVPEIHRARVLKDIFRPPLSLVNGEANTTRRSPPAGKLRLV